MILGATQTLAAECGATECNALRASLQRRMLSGAFPNTDKIYEPNTPTSALPAYVMQLHTPVVRVVNGIASVTVGADTRKTNTATGTPGMPMIHPMSGDTNPTFPSAYPLDTTSYHHIDAIYVEDQANNVIAIDTNLNPASSPSAFLSFIVPKGVTQMTPYASCTVHGVFKGESVVVATSDIWDVSAAYDDPFVCRPRGCGSTDLYGDTLLARWQAQDFTKAGTGIYATPTTAQAEGNLPVFTNSAASSTITISIGKVGSTPAVGSLDYNTLHFTDSIFAVDQTGKVVAYGVFLPQTGAAPSLTFDVPAGVDTLKAFAHSNDFGLSVGEATIAKTTDFKIGTTGASLAQCFAECAALANEGNPLKGNRRECPDMPVFGVESTVDMATSRTFLDLGLARSIQHIEFVIPSHNIADTFQVLVSNENVNVPCDEVDDAKYVSCASGVLTKSSLAQDSADLYFIECRMTPVAPFLANCVKVVTSAASQTLTSVTVRGMPTFVVDASNACRVNALTSDAMLLQLTAKNQLLQTQADDAALYDKHKPYLMIVGNQATITIGKTSFPWVTETVSTHPQDNEHFMDTLYAVDELGRVIAAGALNPSTGVPVTFSFTLPEGVQRVVPYAHCNLHGLFVGDAVYIETLGTTTPSADMLSAACVFSQCGAQMPGRTPFIDDGSASTWLKTEAVRKATSVSKLDNNNNNAGTDALTALHTATLKAEANGWYTVEVPNHPHAKNSGVAADPFAAHFIGFVWVEDQNSAVIASAFPSPMASANNVLRFQMPTGTTAATPKVYCNQHGTYTGATVDSPVLPTSPPTQNALGTCLNVATFLPYEPSLGVSQQRITPCETLASDQLALGLADTTGDMAYVEKHTPFVTVAVDTTKIRVVIGKTGNFHPMLAATDSTVHFVDLIWVTYTDINDVTEVGQVVAPSPDSTLGADGLFYEFTFPTYAKTAQAYSHCNQHGLFTSTVFTFASVPNTPRAAPAACTIPAARCLDFTYGKTNGDAQLTCDASKADLLRGVDKTSTTPTLTPTITLYPATTTTDAYVVLIDTTSGQSNSFRNTATTFVATITVTDNANKVVALGKFSPTEAYSSLRFNIPVGTTSLTAHIQMNDKSYYVSTVTSVTTTLNGAAGCVIGKCLLSAATTTNDYGLVSMPVMSDGLNPVVPATAVPTAVPTAEPTVAPISENPTLETLSPNATDAPEVNVTEPPPAVTTAPAASTSAPPVGGEDDDDDDGNGLLIGLIIAGIVLLLAILGGAFYFSRASNKPPPMSFLQQCELLEEKHDPQTAV